MGSILADVLGTYASAILLILVAVPLGAAVLRLGGMSRFSWLSAAVGLAVVTTAAWLLVRLPGEGTTAAIVLGVAALSAAVWLARWEGLDPSELLAGLPVAAVALVVVSIPFAVEGQFGILGTGFNVDMSQHLFAAEWISRPLGPPPDLIQQGYPVGPHAVAVAGSAPIGGSLVNAFTGTTIAVPVLGALTAYVAVRELGGWRALTASVLAAVPYLVASYLAQGSFKELYLAVFIVGFALWLAAVGRAEAGTGPLRALPAAALGAGALYAYSGPGIAWLVGTLGLWALAELFRRRDRPRALLVAAAVPALVAVVALGVFVAPEIGRIADFGGNASTVANATDREPPPAPSGGADRGEGTPGGGAGGERGGGGGAADPEAAVAGLDLFDDDLGNLFGQISPLEAFGVWPTGDFRVEPGAGAIPAVAFYLGALLGAVAVGVGVVRSLRRGQTALVAALVATATIWLAARAVSTPYATAKALQMVAAPATLLAARELLSPDFLRLPSGRRLRTYARPALAAAFVGAAALSSALALANAPVGPERYTAGIAKLRDQLAGQPLLLLAPPGQLAERHGAAFYGWELRGGRPICVEPFPESDGFSTPPPEGIRYVITLGGKKQAPFDQLELDSRRRRVALWEATDYGLTSPDVAIDPDVPTDCALGLQAGPSGDPVSAVTDRVRARAKIGRR